MVYDLMRNDETLYRLLNFGREGVNYEIVDGNEQDLQILMRLSMASILTSGAAVWINLRWPFLRTGYMTRLGTYMPYTINTRNHIPMQGLYLTRQPVETELAALNDVKTRHQGPLAFGKAGDPVAAVEKFREELMSAGYDIVLAEVQRQIDEWKASR